MVYGLKRQLSINYFFTPFNFPMLYRTRQSCVETKVVDINGEFFVKLNFGQ